MLGRQAVGAMDGPLSLASINSRLGLGWERYRCCVGFVQEGAVKDSECLEVYPCMSETGCQDSDNFVKSWKGECVLEDKDEEVGYVLYGRRS